MKKNLIIIFCLFTSVIFGQSLTELQKKGEESMNSGDNASALEFFKQAIALDVSNDGNSVLYSYAGICAKALDKDDEAKGLFEKAIDRGIKEPIVYNLLGSIYQKSKDYASQEKIYLKAISLFPDMKYDFSIKLCYTYYNSKQYSKLEPVANEILERDTANTKILSFLGVAQQRLNKPDLAVASYTKLIQIEPDNLNANMFLGNYYFQTGKAKIDALKADYDKIKNPDRVVWTETQKKSKLISDEYYAKAKKYLEKSQQIQPDENVAKVLDVIYSTIGK